MRHRVSHRKLGRVTEHRIAMLRNQAAGAAPHERIETTMPKAKELRPFVERIITHRQARRRAGGAATARSLHARRLVLRDIQDRDVVSKLFDTIAPRFEARPGGYTRILRLGYRRGDSAEVAQIELVGSEYDPERRDREGRRRRRRPKPKGVGGRLRAAAERLRGKKAEAPKERREAGRDQSQAGAPAKRDKGGRDRHARQGRQDLARRGRPAASS